MSVGRVTVVPLARIAEYNDPVVRSIWRGLRLALRGVFILHALVIAVVLPFAFWRLFRESGYPWWIQVPAALALLAGFAYLFRSKADEQ